jgi:hypothetical protein
MRHDNHAAAGVLVLPRHAASGELSKILQATHTSSVRQSW